MLLGMDLYELYYAVYLADYYKGDVFLYIMGDSITGAVARLEPVFYATTRGIFHASSLVLQQGVKEKQMRVADAKSYLSRNKITIDAGMRSNIKETIKHNGMLMDLLIDGIERTVLYYGITNNNYMFKVVADNRVLPLVHLGSERYSFVRSKGFKVVDMNKL